MSSPKLSRSGLNGVKNALSHRSCSVERRDRRGQRPARCCARRAPTRTARSPDRRTRARTGAAGSAVTGASGSSGTFMRSVSTSGSSLRGDLHDHVGHAVLPCASEQRCRRRRDAAGTARTCRRTASFVNAERVLVDGRALVLHVRAAVRRAEVAALQVERDVEEHEIEHHRGTRREVAIGRELDERQQRRDVLLVVDVGVPLGEPEAHLLVEPARGCASRRPAAWAAPVRPSLRERRIRERVPGEVLVDVEDDAVVLRPVPLVVDEPGRRRLGVPVLEREEPLLRSRRASPARARRRSRTRG